MKLKPKNVMCFTQREDEFSDLLFKLGLKKNSAKILVYLANAHTATSRDIERATDLRQPEVSIAMSTLMEEKWIDYQENKSENKGRPEKTYTLTLSMGDIVNKMEVVKREEANENLKMIRKMRGFIEDIHDKQDMDAIVALKTKAK